MFLHCQDDGIRIANIFFSDREATYYMCRRKKITTSIDGHGRTFADEFCLRLSIGEIDVHEVGCVL
jgi:hypothetical protein